MAELVAMLSEELKKLQEICREIEENQRNWPEGSLRTTKSGKKVQYYHTIRGGKAGGEYIAKENRDLIQSLAQKEYEKRLQGLAQRRAKQIGGMLKDFQENETERVYWAEHANRRNLLRPVGRIWEFDVKNWLSEPFVKKEFREETPVILTEKGMRVRSKSEKLIADYLDRRGIPYHYEKPLQLRGYGTVYPDFTILSRQERKEIYWEHEGRMDDPAYAKSAVKKIATYEQNGICVGRQLILSFETQESVLNTKDVARIVDTYL